MRFRAEQHLRRPNDIRAVREQGQRLECRAFTLWWKQRATPALADPAAPPTAPVPPTLTAANARVCVIASTAAVGNAVRRNRAKRRLREVFRHQQQAVPADCDLLLIARRAIFDWAMSDLEKTFFDACGRIGSARQPGRS
ncbi:ribonuclease P protein component [Opitutus sp. ER46]|uniref:ribonuclease P protein component n=1 Tax=Opitutus sp. ER46 TaxID=2161864 RepID=UPI000D314BCD|nr:ribonuclease P protein component [Opitutus sp. ER46]PTY00644.1 ribonuclease P protein component [Opitutus sp. ER46]